MHLQLLRSWGHKKCTFNFFEVGGIRMAQLMLHADVSANRNVNHSIIGREPNVLILSINVTIAPVQYTTVFVFFCI